MSASPQNVTEFLFGIWLTMPLSRLRFPSRCCRCGEATQERFDFRGDSVFSPQGMARQLSGLSTSVEVPVPFCGTCQRQRRQRKLLGSAMGIVLGVLLGVTVAWLSPFSGLVDSVPLAVLQSLVVVLVAALGGYAGWLRLAHREPVRLRRYCAQDQTLQIWFEHPAYRGEVERILNDGEVLR